MTSAGFEPALSKELRPKRNALDHSAKMSDCNSSKFQTIDCDITHIISLSLKEKDYLTVSMTVSFLSKMMAGKDATLPCLRRRASKMSLLM